MDLFARNLLLIFFLVVSLGYIMVSQGRIMGLDVTFVLVACVVAVVVIHLGSIIKLIMRGEMVRPISESIFIMAPVLVMAIVLWFGPSYFPPFLRDLTAPCLMLGISLSIGTVFRERKGPWWIVTRAILVLVLGLALRYIASLAGFPDLGTALLVGMALTASFSMLTLFHDHGSPPLRFIGRTASRTMVLVSFLVLSNLLATYVLFLRPAFAAENASLTTTLEWIAFCSVTLIASLLLWRGWKKEVAHAVHGQELILSGMDRLAGEQDRVLDAVTAFVEDGAKDKVLIMLVSGLKENGMDDEEVSRVISRLVRHHDDRVPLMWARAYGDRMARERRARSEVLLQTLEEAENLLGMEGSRGKAHSGPGGR